MDSLINKGRSDLEHKSPLREIYNPTGKKYKRDLICREVFITNSSVLMEFTS